MTKLQATVLFITSTTPFMRASARELQKPFLHLWYGAAGIRTHDLPLRKRTLYQLSYRGVQVRNKTEPCMSSEISDVIKTETYFCIVFKKHIYSNILKVRKMAKIRNQYNQVPQLTQHITWESNKITIRHHKQKSH